MAYLFRRNRSSMLGGKTPAAKLAVGLLCALLVSCKTKNDLDGQTRQHPTPNIDVDCSSTLTFDFYIERSIRAITGIPEAPLTFADVRNITELTTQDAHTLSGLECLESLESLTINDTYDVITNPAGGSDFGDLTPLQYLTHLKILRLPGASISDVTPLAHLMNLEVLDVTTYLLEKNISDIRPLQGLSQLRILNLSGHKIADFSPLKSLLNLSILDLSDTSVADLSALSGLSQLSSLRIHFNCVHNPALADYNTPDNLDTNGLPILPSDFQWCLPLDLRPLRQLPKLKELDLSHNQIADVSALSSLTALTRLNLANNQVSDVTPLHTLTSLTTLDMGENQISDIAPLQYLPSLSVLDLSGNAIVDVSPLSGLLQLSDLVLEKNIISTLTPLLSNSGLGTGDKLFVEGNSFDCLDPLVQIDFLTLQQRGMEVTGVCGCSIPFCNGGQCNIGNANNITCSDCQLNRSGEGCAKLPECTGEIAFDPLVEKAIRETLNIPSGAITESNLASLESLEVYGESFTETIYVRGSIPAGEVVSTTPISDLVGLHCATGLKALSISDLATTHLEPIENLPLLTAASTSLVYYDEE